MDHVEIEIAFPIYLAERFGKNGKVKAFWTYETLIKEVEPYNIESDEYLGWDADGIALRFQFDSNSQRWLKIISTRINDHEGLLEAIQYYAYKIGVAIEIDPDSSELEDSPMAILEQVAVFQEEQRKLKPKWWQILKWLSRLLNEED